MLTLFKKIFIWWNQETLGTKLKTIFFWEICWNVILLVINIIKVKAGKEMGYL